MALLGERYQQDKFSKKAREKFGDDNANNSAVIRTDQDSIMVIGLDSEANKSLEICDRMLDVSQTKKGFKIPEFFDQETKDSGEAGFNSNMILEDSPKEDDKERVEAETMFEKICKAFPLAKNLAAGVKEYFLTKGGKIDSDFKTTISHYELMKCIGKGSFGKVHLGIQILTGAKVAIKTITKKYLALDEAGKKKIELEIGLLMRCSKHSGVVGLLEVFESKDYFFLVTELAARGDLGNILKKQVVIPEIEVRKYFVEILAGIESLHRLKIIHRDIKLDNILIGEDGKARIADLGISKQITIGELQTDICGTPACQPPEMLTSKPYDGVGADIWSLGILLYHLTFGKMPFRAEKIEDLFVKIQSGHIAFPSKPEISPALKDLLCRMLQKDPARRIYLQEIKTHLWLEQYKVEPITEKIAVERLKNDRLAFRLVQQVGFTKKYLHDSLRANAFNHATACYQALFRSLNKE